MVVVVVPHGRTDRQTDRDAMEVTAQISSCRRWVGWIRVGHVPSKAASVASGTAPGWVGIGWSNGRSHGRRQAASQLHHKQGCDWNQIDASS